jgi:uncharacterized membrane protein
VKRFGQAAWQSISNVYDCLQQLISSGNTCTENGYKFTFSVAPPSFEELTIDATVDMVQNAILKFFGAAFETPYAYIEAGQKVYVVSRGIYEIGQILQNPSTGTSTVGYVQIDAEPTAGTLFMQPLMISQGIGVAEAQYAATHPDGVQVLQLDFNSAGYIVGVVDEPTTAVNLDCAPSASCTPRILATVSSLHSIFVFAVPLPANLSVGLAKNLTNVPLVPQNFSAINSSSAQTSVQSTATANQTITTTIAQPVQASAYNELIGLVFLILVGLFFLFIIHGIYKAVQARLSGKGGKGNAQSRGKSGSGGGGSDGLRVLEERYAKGEISKKQFDQMKKDLE